MAVVAFFVGWENWAPYYCPWWIILFAFQLLSDPDPNKKYDEKYHTIHSLYVVEWRKNRELKLRSLSLKT